MRRQEQRERRALDRHSYGGSKGVRGGQPPHLTLDGRLRIYGVSGYVLWGGPFRVRAARGATTKAVQTRSVELDV